MKNLLSFFIAIAILIVGAGMVLGHRYTVVVNSPIVLKFDRLTGDTWIVNSGSWHKIQSAAPEQDANSPATIPAAKAPAKAK